MFSNKALKAMSELRKEIWGDLATDENDLAADLIRCRELLAGMVACAFKDDADAMEHGLDNHDEADCIYCQAKTYLAETGE